MRLPAQDGRPTLAVPKELLRSCGFRSVVAISDNGLEYLAKILDELEQDPGRLEHRPVAEVHHRNLAERMTLPMLGREPGLSGHLLELEGLSDLLECPEHTECARLRNVIELHVWQAK